MSVVRYYNRTRSPLPVTLASGASTAIAPKTWIDVPVEEDGSASLGELVQKGLLVRAAVQPVADPIAVKEQEISPAPPPPEASVAPIASAEPAQSEVSEPSGEPVKASPSRSRSKR